MGGNNRPGADLPRCGRMFARSPTSTPGAWHGWAERLTQLHCIALSLQLPSQHCRPHSGRLSRVEGRKTAGTAEAEAYVIGWLCGAVRFASGHHAVDQIATAATTTPIAYATQSMPEVSLLPLRAGRSQSRQVHLPHKYHGHDERDVLPARRTKRASGPMMMPATKPRESSATSIFPPPPASRAISAGGLPGSGDAARGKMICLAGVHVTTQTWSRE
jgi:hypothetical protein